MQPGRTLLFVYNIDSGVLARIKDYAARESEPGKDGCRLFDLTNSPVGMKKTWKRVIQELGIHARFMNRNEFPLMPGSPAVQFPAVFLQDGEALLTLIRAEEINRCQNLEELIGLVGQRTTAIR